MCKSPIAGIAVGRPLATIGHAAAALPKRVMNERRFMELPVIL
jgi:hypothetical protein